MRTLQLLHPTPDEPALLPGERRLVALVDEKMIAAARIAARNGGELVFQAHETASRQLLYSHPDGERFLSVGTRARLLDASFDGEAPFVVLRGLERVEVETEGAETAFLPVAPLEGGEAAFAEASERLGTLDLLPRIEGASVEEKIDRLAVWLALPPWVQGEVLCLPSLEKRLARILDHATELTCPGGSFRADDLALPFTSDEDYLADRVSHYGSRARVQGGSLQGRRRRAALLRSRATAARLRHRIGASKREGRLPPLENLIVEHHLEEEAIDALLVAGLGSHPRFGHALESAARLLPPGELPLQVWIAALEKGVFAEGQ